MNALKRMIAIAACVGLCSTSTLAGEKNPYNPVKPVEKCGEYGTSVQFADTPAKQAKKDEKLVLVLHVSGHFEDPKLT
jgi:hypothetical protein